MTTGHRRPETQGHPTQILDIRRPREALRRNVAGLLDGTRLGNPPAVAVSASATEVRPDTFTIAVRIRGTSCVVWLEEPSGERHPIDDDIRDELIALAHAARHYN